jgi:hypothetical protein
MLVDQMFRAKSPSIFDPDAYNGVTAVTTTLFHRLHLFNKPAGRAVLERPFFIYQRLEARITGLQITAMNHHMVMAGPRFFTDPKTSRANVKVTILIHHTHSNFLAGKRYGFIRPLNSV